MLDLGYGLTNAAHRTTKGSSDLRRGDFAGSAERLERLAEELRPGILAFVGKAGYEGAFREKPALGLQARRLGATRVSCSRRPRQRTRRFPTRSGCAGFAICVTSPPPRNVLTKVIHLSHVVSTPQRGMR